ncbi:MAG: tetratricopeptide repeat protein [Myxococcales bacterium]|nr:tetratricopeptide repeat protein [Myxococcales bacterium]
MSAADNAKVRGDWKKRESFGSALVQIALVAVILAGAVYFIYQRGAKRELIAKHLKEARTYAMRGNPKDLQKALAEVDEVFKVDSAAPDGLALAADIHTQLWLVHKVPGAEAKAKDFLQRAEAAESRSDERYGTRALHLVAEGKHKDAEKLIEELRKKGANSPRLWLANAKANFEQGNMNLAKQGFAHAMDKAWKDPRFATAYGEALLDDGQLLPALDILSKATSANPDHLQARLDVAMARLYRKDRVKDATDTLTEVLGRDGELTPGLRARALSAKAELANFEARYDDAVRFADEALALNPDEHPALLAKARSLGLRKDSGAAEAFKAALAKRKVSAFIHFEGANLLQAAGNNEAAMGLLDAYQATFKGVQAPGPDGKMVAALDRDDRYWLTRGEVLKATGKLDEAMVAYDKAIAAESVNLVRAHYAKATIYLARKDYDKAAEALVDITPPDGSGAIAEAYVALGDVLFAKKEFAPGCQSFAFALAKMKLQQAPRERLNGILEDVNKRLIAAGQKPMAKLWMQEAKPIIQ